MSGQDPVEFCGTLKRETEKAYLVFDGKNEVWLPKSLEIEEKRQIGGPHSDDYEFTVPEWFAYKNDII